MAMIKLCLKLCSVTTLVFLLLYVGNIFVAIVKRQVNKSVWNPGRCLTQITKNKTIHIVLLLMSAVGLTNLILSHVLSSTQIGAFYEKPEYTEQYDGYIWMDAEYPDEKLFCIFTVWKTQNEYEDFYDYDKSTIVHYPVYTITAVSLPYGCHWDNLDDVYDPQSKTHHMHLNDVEVFFELGDIACESSYTRLQSERGPADGPYCASKNGSAFHSSNCHVVDRIKASNLVYFHNEKEAFAFGYSPCEYCY